MRILTATALAALLCGCATTPVAPPLDTTRVFRAPYEKVWGAVVSQISASYPVKLIDKSSGLITTDQFSPGSLGEFGYPPQVLLACWGASRATMTAFVSKIDDEHTKVRLTGHFECFEFNVSHCWYVWESRGTLENRILSTIKDDVEQGAFTIPNSPKTPQQSASSQQTITYNDGAKYVGERQDGKPNGFGTFVWASGAKYVGEWRAGKRTGDGTYIWPNGDKYVGQWLDNKRSGMGTMTSTNAVVRTGLWRDDAYIDAATNAAPAAAGGGK
jgi:hypothetical protein